jgi:hypothetical protein
MALKWTQLTFEDLRQAHSTERPPALAGQESPVLLAGLSTPEGPVRAHVDMLCPSCGHGGPVHNFSLSCPRPPSLCTEGPQCLWADAPSGDA